jgi:hypothetical protein
MKIKNADMPAMPTGQSVGNASVIEGGLTKREQFAMAAMQGFLSNSDAVVKYCVTANKHSIRADGLVAKDSVRFADALLAELEK